MIISARNFMDLFIFLIPADDVGSRGSASGWASDAVLFSCQLTAYKRSGDVQEESDHTEVRGDTAVDKQVGGRDDVMIVTILLMWWCDDI